MFGNARKPAKPPVIRKITVAKPAAAPARGTNGNAHQRSSVNPVRAIHGSAKPSSSTARDRVTGVVDASSKAKTRRPDSSLASPTPSSSPPRRSAGQKRRAQSPPTAPNFGSSSDEESEQEETASEGLRKRPRPSPGQDYLEPDGKRIVLDERVLTWSEQAEKDNQIIHGYDLTVGKFKEYPVYLASKESNDEVGLAELQYPSACDSERFQLVHPNDPAEYQPIEDIVESVEHICKYYFPPKQAEYLTDEITGYPRRFRKANRERSGPQLITALEDFNAFVKKSVEDGTIPSFLRTQHSVPLPLVERILSQVYARTVSPQVSILKQYENGTDDVYGELLPRFCHQIFADTQLRSDQVFVDLGSGVGNVVLQAALEIGCESWGVERMPNPAGLAKKQVEEFVPRCKRWALTPGRVTALEGDFLATPEIDRVLGRADVVLVNNQAFTPTLNQQLTMKFLDLKEGCQIVSLRSFLPENWQIRHRNAHDPRNLLSCNVKKEYFSGSVSWTDVGGYYYVAKKDSRALRRFLRRQEGPGLSLPVADEQLDASRPCAT